MSWFWKERLTFEGVKDLVIGCKGEILDEVEKLRVEIKNLRFIVTQVYKKETRIMADMKELAEILQEVKAIQDTVVVSSPTYSSISKHMLSL